MTDILLFFQVILMGLLVIGVAGLFLMISTNFKSLNIIFEESVKNLQDDIRNINTQRSKDLYLLSQNNSISQINDLLGKILRQIELLKTNSKTHNPDSHAISRQDEMIQLNNSFESLIVILRKTASQQDEFIKEFRSHIFEQLNQLDELRKITKLESVKAEPIKSAPDLSVSAKPFFQANEELPSPDIIKQQNPILTDEDYSFLHKGFDSSSIVTPEENKSDTEANLGRQQEGSQRFTLICNWMDNHIQTIMKRFNRPSKDPVDLLAGVPADLLIIHEVLEGKILLVGTKDYNRYLALVLPGQYVGASHFDWYDGLRGTNERVEETIEPAIIEKISNEYHIIHRGQIKQD